MSPSCRKSSRKAFFLHFFLNQQIFCYDERCKGGNLCYFLSCLRNVPNVYAQQLFELLK